MLEPFKPEIHRLLREDPKLSGVRVRELLQRATSSPVRPSTQGSSRSSSAIGLLLQAGRTPRFGAVPNATTST